MEEEIEEMARPILEGASAWSSSPLDVPSIIFGLLVCKELSPSMT